MFDIITDIWRNPGAAYSVMPMWLWNDVPDCDTLIKQLDSFHRKGVDSVVIKPCAGMGVEYLSDEYFTLLKSVCEEAKRRFMLVAFADVDFADKNIIAQDKRYAARRLYAQPVTEEVPADEELLYRLFLSFEDGKLTDARLSAADGYEAYNFILGYADDSTLDPLNQYASELHIANTHEKYYEHLSEYFGKTVIGFCARTPDIIARSANSAAWSYSLIEDFFEAGGDITGLAHLLFDTKEKKLTREAEHIYHIALRKNLGTAYHAPLSDWCRKHGVTLIGHMTEAKECDSTAYFDIPGAEIGWQTVGEGEELTARDSALPKLAADCARHNGVSRSSCVCFGDCGNNVTPDGMMRQLNFLFARGCSMVIPNGFSYSAEQDAGPNTAWWKEYRKLAGYIKRMSWLGATGANETRCAVLCSSEHVPTAPVRSLYEDCVPFNYLTLDDFMEKAHVHDGEIHIDRYEYDTVLIDGRLRLNADIVKKLGHFVTQGGKMYRGSAFGSFMKKNAKRRSYFDGETKGKLRFTHYIKSGCDFFLLVNEGTEEISGRFVTDISCSAMDFDPFSGKTSEMQGEMTDGGFAYDMTIAAHCVKVIGMDPNALPKLGKAEENRLCEIASLAEGRMKFDYTTAENRAAKLRFTAVRDAAEVKVNGKEVGTVLFMPYECDITKFLHDGENEVEVTMLGGADAGFDGCTVRVMEKV